MRGLKKREQLLRIKGEGALTDISQDLGGGWGLTAAKGGGFRLTPRRGEERECGEKTHANLKGGCDSL